MSDDVWIMQIRWRIPRAIAECGEGGFASPAWIRLAEIWTERCVAHRERSVLAFIKRHDEQKAVEAEALKDIYTWPMIDKVYEAGLLIETKISPPNTSHDTISSRYYRIIFNLLGGENREASRAMAACFGRRANTLSIDWWVYEHRMKSDEDPSTFEDIQKHPATGWALHRFDTGWELDTDILMASVFSDEELEGLEGV